jgi:hypothetical protein
MAREPEEAVHRRRLVVVLLAAAELEQIDQATVQEARRKAAVSNGLVSGVDPEAGHQADRER